jgi:phenylacetyl-CoA:acceptor oxidoreductase 26-kDa subunit
MSRPQRHWDARAALNFMLGGSGAGLMVAALAIDPVSPWPLALALGLVGAGLTAVWLEIGRKARALHVFFNPFTSWMTRESFAALLLFPLALGSMLSLRFVPAAALAALVFLWCQARILRASRGIPAWRVREVVPLVISTGLAEGAGLALFFSHEGLVLMWFALAVTARALAWVRYRAAVKSAALEFTGKNLLRIGTAGALACALAGAYFAPLAWAAAVAALATGWGLKFVLVTRASAYAGYGLPHLPVRGTR